MLEPEDLVLDIAGDFAREVRRRMEYEVRAAWRAGYDYVHVYDDVGTQSPRMAEEDFTYRQYILPANKGERRPNPPDKIYRFSYDLNSIPDDEIRELIRGDKPE